jgi:rhodanese-related sulfurtransferase
MTIHAMVAEARERITRLAPRQAREATSEGALLIDLRSVDERERHGVIPGSLHIPRSVLEWRVDPDCEHRNPDVAHLDARLILFCAEGYSSSLAAASLQQLGFEHVGDMVGGFAAWKAEGLPVAEASTSAGRSLPGMGSFD